MIALRFLMSVILFTSAPVAEPSPTLKTSISADEVKLYELIMEYRKANGLTKIHLSNSLTLVAQMHAKDLVENKPDLEKRCNAHSWSDQGSWSSCCYTADHKQSSCMWGKPRELTSYPGDGFEIAVGSSESAFDDYIITPQYALSAWKKSIHHDNVILNKSIWKSSNWNAIGVGIYKGFACVWFGREKDLEGEPNPPGSHQNR